MAGWIAAPGRGLAAAHQGERFVEFGVGHAEPAAQTGLLVRGDQIQMRFGDGLRQREAGHVGRELGELQADALGQIARPDAGRIERLHLGEGLFDFLQAEAGGRPAAWRGCSPATRSR